MRTLQEFLEFTENNSVLDFRPKKLKELIESGNELEAWQTILGNRNWYANKGLNLDLNYICGKANNVGITWYSHGGKESQYHYVNGKFDGQYETWYYNGQKLSSFSYKDGKIVGLYESWYLNGEKASEYIYKNGERIYHIRNGKICNH